MRKVHVHVQTDNRDVYMGANVIVSEPPNDPNVAVTIFSTGSTFDQREEASGRVESYLTKAPEWPGYLLENHIVGQRTIQLFQRVGVETPPIGRTLVLIKNEGLPSEALQYVRVIRVESVQRTFSVVTSAGNVVDFQANVVSCDISDALRMDFPGSPPSVTYSRVGGSTVTRDTTVADAGVYYGVVPLDTAAVIGDSKVMAESIYTQLVPSARTETSALDQRPSGERTLLLAETPRRVEIGASPHTMRIKIGQENRGFNFVQILKPFPAPNSVVVSFRALGTWYTLTDDGQGNLTGSGVGTVNYTNGSIAITLPSMPDVQSSVIFSWGEKSAFTSRAGSVTFRPPEFAYQVPQFPIKPGSVTITWDSAGSPVTATDNGTGGLTGSATGEVNYASGKIFIRPTAMIDAGGEFSTAYTFSSQVTENFNVGGVDAGGFATVNLAQEPAPRSVLVRWITVRNVSNSTGVSELVSETSTGTDANGVIQQPLNPNGLFASSSLTLAGGSVIFTFVADADQVGDYTWELVGNGTSIAGSDFGGSLTGGPVTVAVNPSTGKAEGQFTISVSSGISAAKVFTAKMLNASSVVKAVSGSVTAYLTPGVEPSVPAVYPPNGSETREPVKTGGATGAIPSMFPGGTYVGTTTLNVNVSVNPQTVTDPVLGTIVTYDPPAYQGVVWSDAEMTAGRKTIMSQGGVSTEYELWGYGLISAGV
jgi:hypothetical protein